MDARISRRILALLLTLAMILTLVPATLAVDFPDVQETDWFAGAVEYCADKGLMNGTDAGFQPNGTVTREQVIQTLYNMAGKPDAAEGTEPFADIAGPDAWYAPALLWAKGIGLAAGTGENQFGVGSPVTREQLATFFYRYAKDVAKEDVSKTDELEAFPDKDKVSSWALDAVKYAVAAGIISGKANNGVTELKPGDTATRAELASILMRFDKMLVPSKDALQAAVNDAAALNMDLYTGESKTALDEALVVAVEVLNREDATQEEIDAALKALQAAIEALEERDLTGEIVILHTNDTHGALMGFAQVAAVKAQYEKQGAKVILVDAGDFSQGTTYVSTNKGEAAVTMMNAAGYDFVTLGNHEFDFGYAQLKANLEKAEFKALCADVFVKETGESILPAYAVKEIDGVKIGFFGMETPETQTKVNPGLITEITFGTNENEKFLQSAKDAIAALKAEGADVIIGLVHLGVDAESEPYRSIDLYQEIKDDVDFLIDGHSHTVMTGGPDGEPIQSTGTKASKTAFMNVGRITVGVEEKKVIGNSLIPLGEGAEVDETVAAKAKEIMDAVDAEYGAKFAESKVELNGDKAPGNRNMETNLGDLITDSMRWGVLKDMDAETLGVPEENVLAITNGGGIRAWIHKGDVTKNDINTVLPFGNTIAVVYVTGAELLEALEASTYSTPGAVGGFPQVSGIQYTIDTTKEFDKGDLYPDSTYYKPASIKRVTINEINGKPFDPEANYAVVTNNFCAAGGDTYYAFKAASSQFDTGIPMDEMLINYITEKLEGVIGEEYAEPQGRIIIKEALGDLSGKTVILHTNDTHGALMGFAQVAAVKAEYEKAGATVLLMDAGDYSQGTIYVSTNKGAKAVDMLNAAGYDFVTLGNHEFDFGYAQLVDNMKAAEFQLLCADVLFKADGKPAFTPHAIKEVNGMKIGIFGLETPETLTKVHPGLIQEITFPQGEALYEIAKAEVAALKEEGADLIIGLFHLGVDDESIPNRSIDVYNQVEGIDFIIDGHSHTVMTAGPNGEPIQSTGTKASATALMNVGLIVIDNETKKIEKNELIELGEDAPVDETVAAKAQAIMDVIDADYKAVFAKSLVELNGDKAPGNRNMETNLGDLITDSMRWGVLKDMDAETLGVPEENVLAITNGGGIRAWIHAGDVTKADINTVLPFGNTVAVVYVTGAELLEALEASTYSTPGAVGGFPQVSGIKYTIDTTKEFDKGEQYPESTYYKPASIKRVTINEINGKPFDPEANYAVITNNFCAAGGDTYYAFKAASAQFDTGIPMDEMLINFIMDPTFCNGVIGEFYAEPQGRIIIKEAATVETVFPSTTNDDIAKYGNIYTSLDGTAFFESGYTWGDVVTVSFLDKTLDLPVVPTFSYVDQGTPGVFVNKDGETGEPTGRVFMAINMGDFANTYGLATKTTNPDKSYFWTACEGVEFPVPVTIDMKEKGGYATEMEIRDINRTDNRADYPELTDAEFANFRQITTTGMGEVLYRGSSPINPEIGRNAYADAELEKAGVTVIMNLANDQATAEAYPGFAETYYAGQNIIFLNLGVDFAAADFQAGLANGLRFFAANPGVYYVHCTEGKDRAGFVSALLECLMGATADEVIADYLKTYTNYYTVVDGVQQALSQQTLTAIANSNIVKTLQSAFAVEDLKTANLAAEAEEYIKAIGLTDEEIANLKANLAAAEAPISVETTFPSATKADIDKYGDVHFSISSADLAAAGFEYADLVKLSFLDQEVIVPVIPQYRYVGAKAAGLVMWEDGAKPAEVEVFNGSFAATYGLADVVRDGSEYTVTPREGVEFPVPVTITMYEKQGYADTYAIFDLTRSNDREDYLGTVEPYPNLTDEEFANFRKIATTGMGDGTLYRASSPINPSIGRNTYADAAAQAAGVKSFVNLADSETSAAKYAGYAESYYSTQNIIFLNLGVDFTTELNRTGLKSAMEFIAAEDSAAPFLVHCNEGQDRAGFVSALLECLMGATYDEVVADYMVTFYNYYGVQPGTDQYAQISNNIVKNLSTAFGLQMSELATADLAAEAEAYLKELEVSDETIAAVKAKLAGASEPEGYLVVEPANSNNTTRFGHVDIDVTVEDFLNDFALGDIVTVTVNGFTFDAPVVTNYDDVNTGEYLIRCASGKKVVTLAINYGQLGVVAGIVEKYTDPETGNVTYVAKEGVEFPMYATITMKEAGGYAAELAIRKMNRTNNRADYPDLTDAEFANFREVTTTGIGAGVLYRSSSPIDPDLGRNTYADAAAEAAGIKSFVNLADTQAEAEVFEGYADTYYSTKDVKFLGLPVAFTSDEFKAGLAEGYRYIAGNEGPYLIHCLEGKDRTGLSVGVLEALMGANLGEIQNDYLKTYENYFEVTDGVHLPLTEEQATVVIGIITKNLGLIFDCDMQTANLAEEAEAYLTEIGLTADEITALKANLAGKAAEQTVWTPVSILEDGFTYVIYNPGHERAVQNGATANNWYMLASEVTLEDGKILNPPADLLWTVHIDGDGNYTFTQGDNAITMWLSGNYFEVTNDPTVEGAETKWVVTADAEDPTLFYIKSATLSVEGKGDGYLECYNKKVDGVTAPYIVGYGSTAPTATDFGFRFYIPMAVGG